MLTFISLAVCSGNCHQVSCHVWWHLPVCCHTEWQLTAIMTVSDMAVCSVIRCMWCISVWWKTSLFSREDVRVIRAALTIAPHRDSDGLALFPTCCWKYGRSWCAGQADTSICYHSTDLGRTRAQRAADCTGILMYPHNPSVIVPRRFKWCYSLLYHISCRVIWELLHTDVKRTVCAMTRMRNNNGLSVETLIFWTRRVQTLSKAICW